jgi:hypothetical protein
MPKRPSALAFEVIGFGRVTVMPAFSCRRYRVGANSARRSPRSAHSPLHLGAREILVSIIDRLELAAVDRDANFSEEMTAVVTELAKIGFANIRDYWTREGETIDLHRLDQDRTAAAEEGICRCWIRSRRGEVCRSVPGQPPPTALDQIAQVKPVRL